MSKELVLCICPKCKCEHMLELNWIGTCTPRKYCPEHKDLSHSSYELSEYPSFWSTGKVGPRPSDQGDMGQG